MKNYANEKTNELLQVKKTMNKKHDIQKQTTTTELQEGQT